VHDALEMILVIHAHQQRDIGLLRWRRDDDAFRAGREMFCCCIALGEETGGFEYDFNAEIFPGQLRRILRRQNLELLTGDRDAVAAGLHVGLEVAEHRVVLEQVGEGGGIREVVDRDEIDISAAQRGTHDVAANSPEPVDPDLHRHRSSDATVHAVALREAKLRF
jgi:hypothetical protein